MKRILRPPVLFTNPSLRVIQSAGKLFDVSSNDKEETHVFSQYGQISKREAERMKVSPMREVEHEKKLIPPLSQSRYGDMACQTLYVRKDVECARLWESEPAARGTEIDFIVC
jgi:hypothetical protein